MPREMINLAEAARVLCVSKRTVERHIRDGSLKVAYADNKSLMFKLEDVMAVRSVIVNGEGATYRRESLSTAAKNDIERESGKTRTPFATSVNFFVYDSEQQCLELHVFRNPRRGLTPAQRALRETITDFGNAMKVCMIVKDVDPDGNIIMKSSSSPTPFQPAATHNAKTAPHAPVGKKPYNPEDPEVDAEGYDVEGNFIGIPEEK